MASVASVEWIWNRTAGTKQMASCVGIKTELFVVISAASGLTTTTGVTDGFDGSGLTGAWELVGRALNNASVDVLEAWVRRGKLDRDQTLSSTPTGQQVGSTGGGLAVVHIAGIAARSGIGAIRQVGGVLQIATLANQVAGTPALTLPAAPLTSNLLIGAILTASNVSTNTAPPSGWTERFDNGYNTPAT